MSILRELSVRTGAAVLGGFLIAVLAYVGLWGFFVALVGGVVVNVWALIDGLPPSTAFLYSLLSFTAFVALSIFVVWAWHRINPTTLKSKAHKISKLYAEGVELRNRAASLRVLDVASETKMNEIQAQLLEQMRDLAPIQAITLETLNIYNPNNHPKMILQDPKRTLEFSEFLLRVERILERYK